MIAIVCFYFFGFPLLRAEEGRANSGVQRLGDNLKLKLPVIRQPPIVRFLQLHGISTSRQRNSCPEVSGRCQHCAGLSIGRLSSSNRNYQPPTLRPQSTIQRRRRSPRCRIKRPLNIRACTGIHTLTLIGHKASVRSGQGAVGCRQVCSNTEQAPWYDNRMPAKKKEMMDIER